MIRVLLIAALSADGFISQSENEPADWTSSEDKRNFAKITRDAGVVVMGARTFATIGHALPGRRNIVYSHRKINVPDVEVTQESPRELVTRLGKEGCKAVAIIGGRTVFQQFVEASFIDELYLTIEPIIFGQGLLLFESPMQKPLKLLNVKKLNDAGTLLLHYGVC